MTGFRVFLLFVLLITALPFELYNYIIEYRKFIMVSIHGIMAVDFLVHKHIRLTSFNLLFWISGIVCFGILILFKSDLTYINYIIQFTAVLFVLIYIDTFFLYQQYIKLFISIILITGIMGVVVFFLALSGQAPFSTLETESRTLHNYYLTFSPDVIKVQNTYIIRYSGYFDEPGTFAYYTIYALFLAYLNSYKKIYLIVLLVAGIFSLSLAFILTVVLIFIYYFFFASRFSFYKIFIILLGIFFLYFLYNVDSIIQSPATKQLSHFLKHRIELGTGKSGKLVKGDNRTQDLIFSYHAFLDNPLIGVDKGDPKVQSGKLSANFFSYFALHGIIGSFALYFMLLYFIVFILLKKQHPSVFFILFLVLLNFYQRPFFSSGYMGYLLLPTLIYSVKRFSNNNVQMTPAGLPG